MLDIFHNLIINELKDKNKTCFLMDVKNVPITGTFLIIY